MKNKASVWCYVSAVICYITGALYCCSLIFLPVAIYCFVFGNRYLRIAKITDAELSMINGLLVSSAIFVSIFAFPIGLVSIAPVLISRSNATVSDTPKFDNASEREEAETVKAEEVEVTEAASEQKTQGLTDEDLEKIEKLTAFRNQGLLSEEEFEDAKRQIINKK